VPLAAESEQILVYAHGEQGTTAVLVPRDASGLTVSAREQNMGLKGIATYEIELKDCRVPVANQLQGSIQPLLNRQRVAGAALAIGVARAAFEYSRDYAKERKAFRRLHRPEAGDRLHARRDGDRDRRHAPAHLGSGVAHRPR
jgi:alkylation response protein AidB-like acyl-CoA dehydrogenase